VKLPAPAVTPTTVTLPPVQGVAMLAITMSVAATHLELVMVSVSVARAASVVVELREGSRGRKGYLFIYFYPKPVLEEEEGQKKRAKGGSKKGKESLLFFIPSDCA
jgi:hypothetical protein